MLVHGNIDWKPAHYCWMQETVAMKGKYHLHRYLPNHTLNKDDCIVVSHCRLVSKNRCCNRQDCDAHTEHIQHFDMLSTV